MQTIKIHAEDMLVKALKKRTAATSLEALIREALAQYVASAPPEPPKYSFIGIGHSDKEDLSTRVDETLAQGANRREGWSLPE